MKEMIKKNIKLIIAFILGGIVVGTISATASTIIAGSNISYNNTSGLKSTNVQSAIDELNTKTNIGTATASEIIAGKTALVNGSLITGTMTNVGAWTSTPTTSGKITIPYGFHNGKGYVDTSSIYQAGIDSVKNNPVDYNLTNNSTSGDILIGKTNQWDYTYGTYSYTFTKDYPVVMYTLNQTYTNEGRSLSAGISTSSGNRIWSGTIYQGSYYSSATGLYTNIKAGDTFSYTPPYGCNFAVYLIGGK